MTSPIIERAALAILSDISLQGGNYSIRSTIGPTIVTDAAIDLSDAVRAVLTALREPNEAMQRALDDYRMEHRLDDAASERHWQAMIDAALAG